MGTWFEFISLCLSKNKKDYLTQSYVKCVWISLFTVEMLANNSRNLGPELFNVVLFWKFAGSTSFMVHLPLFLLSIDRKTLYRYFSSTYTWARWEQCISYAYSILIDWRAKIQFKNRWLFEHLTNPYYE